MLQAQVDENYGEDERVQVFDEQEYDRQVGILKAIDVEDRSDFSRERRLKQRNEHEYE